MKKTSKRPDHVFISIEKITLGQMDRSKKYVTLAALCIALEPHEPHTLLWNDRRIKKLYVMRQEMRPTQHWGALVKPTCEHCELLQAMLRVNIAKADRLTFSRADFIDLMQRIGTENVSTSV